MEETVPKIYQSLQKILGLHRQLLDIVRSEREALTSADLTAIQGATYAKEAIVQAIQQQEQLRLELIGRLALKLKKPLSDLTLNNLAILVQGTDLKQADQLRTTNQALTLLIKRIQEQNTYNRGLIEESLEHVRAMKKNVLGEYAPKSETYSPNGQRKSGSGASRLISKEV